MLTFLIIGWFLIWPPEMKPDPLDYLIMDPAEVRRKIQAASDKWNLKLSAKEVEEYGEILDGDAKTILSVSELDQDMPEVKYPRDQGYRPPPEENPYNAWYYKTDIRGASSGKLSGKKIAIKDNVCVAGVPMMNGSRLVEGYVPTFDATVVTRILDAGGTIAGKAVCEDICFSAGSFTSATGPVLNVNDVTRSAGGSSSGSGALVRCGDVDMAIGGDQGGSIRVPSSYQGIVGFKASFGLVPYTGAFGVLSCLDYLGPITKTVEDCALLLEVIAGADGMDPRQETSYKPPEYSTQLKAGVSGMKIGLVKEGLAKSTPEVAAVVREAATKLREAGAIVEEVSMQTFDIGPTAVSIITMMGFYETHYRDGFQTPMIGGVQNIEVLDHLKKHQSERLHQLSHTGKYHCLLGELFTQEERVRLMCQAQNALRKLKNEYNCLLETYSVLIMPTLPKVADKLPDKDATIKDEFECAYGMIPMTSHFNLTHHPALTLPCGHVDGLPVGLMIIGKRFDEQTVLNVAYTYEGINIKK